MRALILAGGKGTRLRPLTVYTPKPIVPFMNRPFLLYQIEILKKAGINEVVLSLSYRPDKIIDLIGDGSEQGVCIEYVTEPSPMGTAGAYRFASKKLQDTTLVLNGDILTDFDISELIAFHRERGSDVTIALTSVEKVSGYGIVELDPEGRVLSFKEKPKDDGERDIFRKANAGIYIIEPKIDSWIPEGESFSFEYDLFPLLIEKEAKFFGYLMKESYWNDIGTPPSYLQAHLDFLAGKIKGFHIERKNDYEQATAAFVDNYSVIGKDSIIKPNAKVVNSIIGNGVLIEEKAVVENSVIWSNTRVASSSQVKRSIICRSCYIGKNAVVGEGSVLGDKTSLADYTQV